MQSENKMPLTPTARLLLDAFRAFENELVRILASNGFNDVTTGNFNILRHLNPQGMRLTELAKDAQISKQAIGKMIRELENKGYVTLLADENDARAKHVKLTTKGEKLIQIAITAVTEMENKYLSMLGKLEYKKLRSSVIKICELHQKDFD